MGARTHLRQRCLCLREPESHVHRAVKGNSGGQGHAGLLRLTGLGVQYAEAAVAVGLERAHPQLLGQGEGLLVVRFGLRSFSGRTLGGDLPEEPQGVGSVSPFLMGLGERQRPLRLGRV